MGVHRPDLSSGFARRGSWAALGAAVTALLALAPAASAAAGDLLVSDANAFGGTGGVFRVNPATGARTVVSANFFTAGPDFSEPDRLALEDDGDVLVVDEAAFGGAGGVIRVDPGTGVRTSVSENAAPAGAPTFLDPIAIVVESGGDAVIADSNAFGGTGGLIRVDPGTGARTAVSENTAPAGAPDFADPYAVTDEPDGDLVVVDLNAFTGTGGVIRVDPTTGVRTAVSENTSPAGLPAFVEPRGVAIEADGDILVTDLEAFGGGGGVIRVDPVSGVRTTVSENSAPAGGPSFVDPFGIGLEEDGDILVTDVDAFGGGGGVIRVDPVTGARTTVSENSAPAGAPFFVAPASVVVEPTPPAPPTPPPADPPVDPGPAADTSPPDTTITDGPSGKVKSKTATFAFSGTDARAVAGFQCKLDGGSFEPCSSPKTYSGLKKGSHTVEVRAVDGAGNVDPTPATRSWKIKKKKKKK
jgi:hypothetical protein